MRPMTWLRMRPVFFCGLLLALVLAACGGDGGSDPTETTISDGETETTSEETETPSTEAPEDITPEISDIRVMPTTIPQYLPIFVAGEVGIFEEYGLNVEILEFEGGAGRSTEALFSGEIDIGYTSWPLAFSLAERGQQLKFLTFTSYYARQDGVDYGTHRLIVPEDSAIESAEDLEGARIGVIARGSNEEAFLVSILNQAGVDPSSVELVEAFWADHPSLLEAGEIDVGYMIYPFVGAIIPYGETEGNGFRSIGDPYLGGNGIPEMLGDRGAALFPMSATSQYVEENPNTVQAFAFAFRDAVTWIRDNPEEALQISVDATGIPEEAQRSNPPHLYVTWPEDLESQMQFVSELMVEADLLEGQVDVSSFISGLPFSQADMTAEERTVSWVPSSLE